MITTELTCKRACASYHKRFRSEIVQTQMAKGGGFAFEAGGHDIADFHLAIIGDDAINEECDQLSALGKGQGLQGRLDPTAKRLEALSQRRHIDMVLSLRIQLAQLLGQAMLGLGHLLSFPIALVPLDHFAQVYIEQASVLAFELGEDCLQRVAARWQRLR